MKAGHWAGWTRGRPSLQPLTQLQRPQVGYAGTAGQAVPSPTPTTTQPSRLSLPCTQGPWICLQHALLSALKISSRKRNTKQGLPVEIPQRFTLN